MHALADLGTWSQGIAYSGSLVLAVPVCIAAGLLSFFSPCVVPLVPGYLAFTTGLGGSALADGRRGRMLAGACLFVLGFSIVFLSFGAMFGQLGAWFHLQRRTLDVSFGIITAIVGLAFVGLIPFAQRDLRFRLSSSAGLAGAPALGFVFALGWTPCLGPTLTAVLSLATNESSAVRGTILSAAYCLGLGVPFVVAALTYHRALRMFTAVRRHHKLITRAGGAALVVIGIMLATGSWDSAVSGVRDALIRAADLT